MFLGRLYLADDGWSSQDQQVLTWIRDGAMAGLSFSQGIHGHGIWLKGSCVWFMRKDVQTFGSCYSHLASHSLHQNYNLFGMVPKLHAMMHYRTDFDLSVREQRECSLGCMHVENCKATQALHPQVVGTTKKLQTSESTLQQLVHSIGLTNNCEASVARTSLQYNTFSLCMAFPLCGKKKKGIP